jgi:hypothetical protein
MHKPTIFDLESIVGDCIGTQYGVEMFNQNLDLCCIPMEIEQCEDKYQTVKS